MSKFKKLLSNLPFNPSLINQVAFYGQRIHHEEKVRRTGLLLVVLAILVQMFAVISPPESTIAQPTNDIVEGGFSTRVRAAQYCDNNTKNFKTILDYYGVSCNQVATAGTRTIKSTDYYGQLDSLGRTPQGEVIIRPNGKRNQTNEYKVPIDGTTYYMKNFWAWDSGAYSTYKVLEIKKSDGSVIFITYDCGNIVTVGEYPPPEPPVPPPTTQIACSNLIMNLANGSRVEKNSNVSVRGQATGKDFKTSTPSVDMYYDVINIDTGRQFGTTQVARGVRFNDNVAEDSTARTFKLTSTGRFRLRLNVKYDSGTKTATGSQTGNCTKQLNVSVTDVCPNKDGTQTSESECDVCPAVPGTQYDEIECKPCEDSINNNDAASCLDLSKKANNDTQNIANANETTAKAGNSITYTLSVKNNAKVTVQDFIVEENLADVLMYADVVDLHGGKLGDDYIVRWPAVDIQAGATFNKQITVKIKSPIPETPASPGNPSGFDLVLTNVYGNAINIKLPNTPVKTIEMATTTLPNTGPGEVLAISVTVTVIASYFFARSRLIGKELDLVRAEYTTSGGL